MTRDLTSAAIAAAAIALLLGAAGCEDEMMDAQPKSYVGVGVEITMEAAGARVTRVLEGGGAKLAGVERGDVFLEVDGNGLRGRGLAEVVDMLRGVAGTQVKVLSRTTSGNQALLLMRKPLANP
jgi:C-terminal processing protease CtpA/Prc